MSGKNKSYKAAKKITLFMLFTVGLVGIVGAFLNEHFNMSGYIEFVKAYAPFFVSLIGSIGFNSYKSKKIEEKANSKKDTEEEK